MRHQPVLLSAILQFCVIFLCLAQADKVISYNSATHHSAVKAIATDTASSYFFTAGADKRIIKWNFTSDELTRESQLSLFTNPGFEGGIDQAIAISKDFVLLAGNFSDGNNQLLVADLENKVIKERIPIDASNSSLVGMYKTTAGIFIVYGDGEIIGLKIDLNGDPVEIKKLRVPADPKVVAINSDGTKWLVAEGGEGHKLFDFDPQTGSFNQRSSSNKHHLKITAAAFAEDGSFVTAGLDGKIFSYKSRGGYGGQVGSIGKPLNQIAISKDGNFLVAFEQYSGRGHVYSISGEQIADFEVHDNAVTACSIFQNEKGENIIISSGGSHNQLAVWNLLTGQILHLVRSEGGVIWDLAIQNEPRRLFIAAQEDKDYYKFFIDITSMVSKDVSGQRISLADTAGQDISYLDNYRVSIGNRTISNDPQKDGRVLKAISAGDYYVVGSDFSLKVYDQSGYLYQELQGHMGGVRALAYDAQQNYLFSGGDDQQILVWNFEQLTDDIKPSFYAFIDEEGEFIFSSEDGYFAASQQGSMYLSWMVGEQKPGAGTMYPAEQYFNILYRPEDVRNGYMFKDKVANLVAAKGERVFDLTKIDKPSAAVFQAPFARTAEGKVFLPKENGTYVVDSDPRMFLDLDVYDGGGGVKELKIYHNEKLVVLDDEFDDEKKKFNRNYEVSLVPGINEFKVSVINYQEIESSLNQKVSVQYNGVASATSDLYVFVIGINKYDNPTYELNYAEPDARSFLDQIRKTSEGIFDEIKLHYLFNQDAQKDAIEETFREIASQATLQDVFIFYYAGHGVMAKLDEDTEDYFLVTPNVTQMYGGYEQLQERGFSSNQLKHFTAEIKAQKQLVLIDACNSGGAVTAMAKRGAAEEKAIFQLARSSGIVLISASGTQQFATEFKQLGHGAFTYVLLQALKGAADGGNKDKKITVNELKAYMEDMVPQITLEYGNKAQYPTGFSTGQDFPIGVVKD